MLSDWSIPDETTGGSLVYSYVYLVVKILPEVNVKKREYKV